MQNDPPPHQDTGEVGTPFSIPPSLREHDNTLKSSETKPQTLSEYDYTEAYDTLTEDASRSTFRSNSESESDYNENTGLLNTKSSPKNYSKKISKSELSEQILNSRRRRTRVTDHPEANEYIEKVRLAKRAIDEKILPELIAQGSSGSYFVKGIVSQESGDGSKSETIAVFKPKNEEPYAILNPKWTKWIQRNFCSCCFGRSCLIPNQGFTSEAAASVVDSRLNLNLVPLTGVVRLSSESFHYTKLDKYKAQAKAEFSQRFPSVGRRFRRIGLPPKIGSFQLFVNGYKGADEWLRIFEHSPPPENLRDDFIYQFQKLTVLDYIIRNTDRGGDNWLIKYSEEENTIKIAAIDNGLAFPYKHPDAWRTYPYSWSWLEIATKPFSDKIVEDILPLISDQGWVNDLVLEIQTVFAVDRSFSISMFERQMSVMRGQILNATQALKDRRSPMEMTQMPPVYVKKARKKNVFGRLRAATMENFIQSFQRDRPFFSGF